MPVRQTNQSMVEHWFHGGQERMRSIAEGLEPVDVGLATEPGELTFGVVAMTLLGGFDCVG